MKGSEKQISWAEDIKRNAIEACDRIIESAEKYEANKSTAYMMSDGSIELMETVNGRQALVLYKPIKVAVAKQLKDIVEDGFAKIEEASEIIDKRASFSADALMKMALLASRN